MSGLPFAVADCSAACMASWVRVVGVKPLMRLPFLSRIWR